MPIRRFWVVAPMDLITDEQARELGRVLPNRGEQRTMPVRRGGLRPLEDALPMEENLPEIALVQALELSRKDAINQICGSESSAHALAKSLAEKTPTKPYGVFSCIGIYETKEPEIIRKEFNASNEIVMITDEQT